MRLPSRPFLRPLLASCCLLPAFGPGQALAQADASAPAAQARQPGFDVHEYQIEGNSVLATERIERAVYPFMGDARTIADVEAARAALEQSYRDSGYGTVSVDIPPQKVVDGVVTLRVVEGRIARLRVTGSRYYSQGRIIDAVPGLAEGQVPNLPEVQKQLAAVNTSAERRVTPLLRPGKEPGTTEVDLQVDDTLPLHGSAELNNHHAAHSSSLRAIGALRYANLFQREHMLGVQMQTSPQAMEEVRVFAGTYSLPAFGGNLVMSLVRSNSTSYVGGGIGVFGDGKVYGARLVLPLPSEAPPTELLQSLTLGMDLKYSFQQLALDTGASISTPIHYAPITAAYAAYASDPQGSTEYGAGLTFAIRNLVSRQDQFSDKRFKALSDFAILKFNLGRTQKLAGDMSLYARVEGQLASTPLVSNEQYVAGGVDTVRGYLESAQTGDAALRGTLEFRTSSFVAEAAWLDELRLRAFLDGAYQRTLSPLPGTAESYELASAGFGLTMKSRDGFSLRGDLAWPMRSLGGQSAWRPRLQASADYEF